MDLLLFDPAQYDLLYNCTFYNVSDVPLEERQHTALGILFLLAFLLCETLYISCLVIIGQQCLRESYSSCYRIMLFIGLADVLNLPAAALYPGAVAIVGSVFCSAPTTHYWIGLWTTFFWGCETTGSVLLAFNRVLSLVAPNKCEMLFGGRRMWAWLGLLLVYSCYYALFHMPMVFLAVNMGWTFNPHLGYAEDYDGNVRWLID